MKVLILKRIENDLLSLKYKNQTVLLGNSKEYLHWGRAKNEARAKRWKEGREGKKGFSNSLIIVKKKLCSMSVYI